MSLVAPAAPQKTAVRWAQIRHELLNFTWLLMELALITPVGLALLPWARLWSPLLFFLLLTAVMLLPFLLARLLNLLAYSKPAQQNVMVVALLITELLILRTLIYAPTSLLDLSWLGAFFSRVAEPGNQQWFFDIALFLLVAIVWWRGIRLVGREPSIDKAGLFLRGGGLLLAPIAIWLGRSLLWNITPFLLLFFAAGLTTIALIRAEQLEIQKSGQSAAVTPRWLLTIMGVTLLILTTAVSLAAIFSTDVTVRIVRFFAPVWATLTFALRVLSSTLLYVGRPLFFVLESLFLGLSLVLTWLLLQIAAVINEGAAWAGSDPAAEPFPLLETEEAIRQTLNDKLIVFLLMFAVVLVVSLAIRRALQGREVATATVTRGQRPLASQQDSLLDRVKDRLSDLLNWRTAVSIRRTYRHMCQTAASLGYARGSAQTPYEYLVTLQQAWPEHQEETAVITNAYINIRYGEYPETAEEVEKIRSAWHRLAQAARDENGRQTANITLQNEPK